jgi:hypothetical protein
MVCLFLPLNLVWIALGLDTMDAVMVRCAWGMGKAQGWWWTVVWVVTMDSPVFLGELSGEREGELARGPRRRAQASEGEL